ncbi:MAG: hypothetical protein ABIP06_12600 [Pyrinomonadaceae bacterium]
MKVLRQILLLTAITVGFSLTAMAQKQDPKKDPPPKQDPPKIRVEDKKNDRPKDDKPKDERKKPDLAFIKDSGEVEII